MRYDGFTSPAALPGSLVEVNRPQLILEQNNRLFSRRRPYRAAVERRRRRQCRTRLLVPKKTWATKANRIICTFCSRRASKYFAAAQCGGPRDAEPVGSTS